MMNCFVRLWLKLIKSMLIARFVESLNMHCIVCSRVFRKKKINLVNTTGIWYQFFSLFLFSFPGKPFPLTQETTKMSRKCQTAVCGHRWTRWYIFQDKLYFQRSCEKTPGILIFHHLAPDFVPRHSEWYCFVNAWLKPGSHSYGRNFNRNSKFHGNRLFVITHELSNWGY